MTARTPELTEALSRVNEEEVGRCDADAPPLSHPYGAEPVPVSGKAGIANAGFTPGPWSINYADGRGGNIIAKTGPVADTRWFGNTHKQAMEDYANAHLIAAAPELYEALASLCAVLNSNGYSTAHADAALAKARGDS